MPTLANGYFDDFLLILHTQVWPHRQANYLIGNKITHWQLCIRVSNCWLLVQRNRIVNCRRNSNVTEFFCNSSRFSTRKVYCAHALKL